MWDNASSARSALLGFVLTVKALVTWLQNSTEMPQLWKENSSGNGLVCLEPGAPAQDSLIPQPPWQPVAQEPAKEETPTPGGCGRDSPP